MEHFRIEFMLPPFICQYIVYYLVSDNFFKTAFGKLCEVQFQLSVGSGRGTMIWVCL